MVDTPIVVRLVDAKGDGVQIANVLVDVRFYMQDRYRYGFTLGRTGADGLLDTNLADIQAKLDENRSYFLMDYNTPLSDCDGAVGIYVPTSDELTEREVGRLKWWPEREPLVKTANHLVICVEQKFTMRRDAPNDFALACDRA